MPLSRRDLLGAVARASAAGVLLPASSWTELLAQSQGPTVAPGKEKLLVIAKQAGFSEEKFDQCLADKELFEKIVETRKIAHEKFGVDSTPSFFVNGKRLKGDHQLKDFDVALGEAPAPAPEDANKAKSEGTTTPMTGQ